MVRAVVLMIGALLVSPALASAQQPCTTDARQVVNELYRHVLERSSDPSAEHWVQQLASGNATVREVVRQIAMSPEHTQRFASESHDRNVATLYRHLLGRQPDDAGLRAHTQLAAERGMNTVIDRIISSNEYRSSLGEWGVPGSGGMRFCAPGTGTAGTSGTTTFSSDMRFRGLDRNRDGRITRNEWRGNNRSFQRHDWNGDGVLSGDEVRPGAEPPNGEMDDFAAVDRERFDYLDYNANGRLDSHEWDGTPAAFDRLDRNNDGTLTRAELGMTRSVRFSNLDVNNDGHIALDEWRWSRTAFDRQDLDGDGVLTQDEYRDGAVGTSGFR